MIPSNLPDQIADLYGRMAEIERRARNRKRTGIVSEIGTGEQKGQYRVKLSEQGGKPYLTGWLRPKQLGAGLVKIDVLLSKGEQVDVVSESGDLADASIDLSTYSQHNPRANDDTPFEITIEGARFAISGDTIVLKAGKIILDGDVDAKGGYLHHQEVNVGVDHVHTEIKRGTELSGPPAE